MIRKLALILIAVLWCGVAFSADEASQYDYTSSQYLYITDAAQSGLKPGNSDFYVCAFVYADTYDYAGGVLSKGYNPGSAQFEYFLRFTGTNCSFRGYYDNSHGTSAIITETHNVDTWYFVEGYHDATNDLLGIAVDGGTFTTIAFNAAGLNQTTQLFTIGSNFTTSALWDGRIDQVAVYSALPDASLRAWLRNSGCGRHYSEFGATEKTNLVSFWEFDDELGLLVDSHGSNDLSNNNTVTQSAGVTNTCSGGGTTQIISCT